MPKTNKHIEVKPSKYKTSICQYFVRGDECPFGARCAFAHGEAELQSEERNVELLKQTGLQRLDGGTSNSDLHTASGLSSSADSCEASCVVEPIITTPVTAPRRRPVMVSLPKYNTASENYQSPYVLAQAPHHHYGALPPCDFALGARVNPQYLSEDYAGEGSSHCNCVISSTCRNEQPLTYRHNPYNMTARLY